METSETSRAEMIRNLVIPKKDGLECKFCGANIVPRILSFGGREIHCGFQSCECDQAKAAEIEIDNEIARQVRLAEARDRQAKIDKIFAESCIGERFKQRTFDSFRIESEEQRKGFDAAARFAEDFRADRKTRGIFLYGEVGTGKTHLAAAVANKVMADAIPVLFGTSAALLARLKKGWQDDSDIRVMDALCSVPLLIIDDLGKEFAKKTDGWSWVHEQLYQVINRRYEDYLPVIVTTNLDLDELAKRIDPAVVSRIVEMCRGVRFDGKDQRMGA